MPLSDFSINYRAYPQDNYHTLEDSHASVEIVLFLRADLSIFIKDMRYHIQDGDLLFIPSFQIHHIVYADQKDYFRYMLQFRRRFMEPYLWQNGSPGLLSSLSQRKNCKWTIPSAQWDWVVHLFANLHRLHQDSDLSETVKEAALHSALFLLLLELERNIPASQIERQGRGEENQKVLQIQKILQYIDQHYAEPLSLEKLEQTFFLSPNYICTLFKEVAGLHFSQYVQLRRISQAKQMLLHTDLSVTEIGFACGFNSAQDFHRVFKQVRHLTPLQYRKQGQ